MTVPILLAVSVINLALGLVVFATNRARRQNQCFMLLTLALGMWSVLLSSAVSSRTAASADLLIRATSCVAILIPISIHLLFLSIVRHGETMKQIARHARWTIGVGAGVGVLVWTPLFMSGARLPDNGFGIPVPLYGPGFLAHSAYFAVSLFWLVTRYSIRLRRETMVARLELEFTLLGIGATVAVATFTNLVMPIFGGMVEWQQYGPISVLVMNAVIAYGIAMRRLMEVRQLVRSFTAYGLLAAYLLLVYAVVWFSSVAALGRFTSHSRGIAHLFAAIALAFLLSPVHGRMQKFAKALFAGLPVTDVAETISRASSIVQSIGTVQSLVGRFSGLISGSLDVPEVAILIQQEDEAFRAVASARSGALARPPVLRESDPILRRSAVSLDLQTLTAMSRAVRTDDQSALESRMRETGIEAFIAVQAKGGLQGVILLGPRTSGRVYGTLEFKALRALADHLAIALENARLYTEVQNSKIYNEILLDNLVSGVIAVDVKGTITRFNREAQRILGIGPEEMADKPADVLPEPLAAALADSLRAGVGVRHSEAVLEFPGGEMIPVEMGSTGFQGHDGSVMGALLVFSDLTVVKKLETQVRRTSHLASLGTLSAGMAHEIKNPLVTLKTFSQLLTERYDEEEFRNTFSELVQKEVNRIDGIVNQLLEFSRPSKAELKPVSASDILRHAIRLVDAPLKQRRIHIETSWVDEPDVINADAGLLEQVFINFFLNAIEAMNPGGALRVSTKVVRPGRSFSGSWESVLSRPHVSVEIADTGCGMSQDVIQHIFDPFFTTKSGGTGLGLSVAHGIVQEHNGLIDVESSEGKGSVFHIFLPIRDKADFAA
ncbi:MAG: PAS domain-containing protein [Lentisphaerae bacterium]|nr:PAS domain-containing protein [Lentisphaerota bacterium]